MMMVINSQDELLYVTNTQRKWTTKIRAFSFALVLIRRPHGRFAASLIADCNLGPSRPG
jgi:hypothetical protein